MSNLSLHGSARQHFRIKNVMFLNFVKEVVHSFLHASEMGGRGGGFRRPISVLAQTLFGKLEVSHRST